MGGKHYCAAVLFTTCTTSIFLLLLLIGCRFSIPEDRHAEGSGTSVAQKAETQAHESSCLLARLPEERQCRSLNRTLEGPSVFEETSFQVSASYTSAQEDEGAAAANGAAVVVLRVRSIPREDGHVLPSLWSGQDARNLHRELATSSHALASSTGALAGASCTTFLSETGRGEKALPAQPAQRAGQGQGQGRRQDRQGWASESCAGRKSTTVEFGGTATSAYLHLDSVAQAVGSSAGGSSTSTLRGAQAPGCPCQLAGFARGTFRGSPGPARTGQSSHGEATRHTPPQDCGATHRSTSRLREREQAGATVRGFLGLLCRQATRTVRKPSGGARQTAGQTPGCGESMECAAERSDSPLQASGYGRSGQGTQSRGPCRRGGCRHGCRDLHRAGRSARAAGASCCQQGQTPAAHCSAASGKGRHRQQGKGELPDSQARKETRRLAGAVQGQGPLGRHAAAYRCRRCVRLQRSWQAAFLICLWPSRSGPHRQEPSYPLVHSVCEEADYVPANLAPVLGHALAFTVELQSHGLTWSHEADPRVQECTKHFADDPHQRCHETCELGAQALGVPCSSPRSHMDNWTAEGKDSRHTPSPVNPAPTSCGDAGIAKVELEGRARCTKFPSCLKGGHTAVKAQAPLQPQRKVRFAFEVSFWFPASTQLRLCTPCPVKSGAFACKPEPPCSHAPAIAGRSNCSSNTCVELSPAHSCNSSQEFPCTWSSHSTSFLSGCHVDPTLSSALQKELDPAGCSSSSQETSYAWSSQSIAPTSKARSQRNRSPNTSLRLGAAISVPAGRRYVRNSQAAHPAFSPATLVGAEIDCSRGDRFTSLDVLSQAVVLTREADWDPHRCVREAVQRTLIPNPGGRLMRTQILELPGPQVIIQSFGTLRTHRAIVLVCESCVPSHTVCECPLGISLRSFLFTLATERAHPWAAAVYNMLSYSCAVDYRPFSCNQALPCDADVVQVVATEHEAAHAVATVPDTIPISGLPVGNSVESRPYAAGDARPPVPPTPGLGRRWGTSTILSMVHQGDPISLSEQGNAEVASQALPFDAAGDTFVEYLHMRVLPIPRGAAAHHLVEIAYLQTAQLLAPRGHRFLRHAIPGLPPIQLCVWGQLAIGEIVVPFLTQDARRPVCTTRVAKSCSAFEAALEVEQACGYGPFLHQGLNRRQIHLEVNGYPQQPHCRWTFQQADFAAFRVGPPLAMTTAVTARTTPAVPNSLPVVTSAQITDGEATEQIIVHRLGCHSVPIEAPGILGPRSLAAFLESQLNTSGSYGLHFPITMPLCQGTPLHCLLLPTTFPRTAHVAILDLRRVLCPPTAPFIVVEVAPLVSFHAIVSGVQGLVQRHRPITAAYLNDELVGACTSVPSTACVITLLSYGQTRSPAAQASVCVMDTLAEAICRPGLLAHF